MIAPWQIRDQLFELGTNHSAITLAHSSCIKGISQLFTHGILTPTIAAEAIRNLTTQMAECSVEQIDKLAAIANELDPPAFDSDAPDEEPEAATRDSYDYDHDGNEYPTVEQISPGGTVYEATRA